LQTKSMSENAEEEEAAHQHNDEEALHEIIDQK